MNNQNKPHNQKIRRNNRIFALLMLVTQVGLSIIYGVMYKIDAAMTNVSAILNVIGLAILVVAGFGLVLAYLKRLVWSGLGFTLLITALSIQVYPLLNQFWSKTRINPTSTPHGWAQYTYSLLLSNSEQSADKLYGNCISNAFKCALAIVVAFSSILGRVGSLECWIVTIIGVTGFELNRIVILNLSNDAFGAYFIFTFGGFMGLALGLLLNICREKLDNGCSTSKNRLNTSYFFSSSLSLFGSLIIFALFPLLAYDVENTNIFNTFYLYTGPTSVLLGMGTSVVGALCVTVLANGGIIFRDIVHAPIAGGIVVGSASFYITNPVYALVAGFTAGVVQTLIQNFIEKPFLRSRSVVSTISWSLFGVQGILGGAFASGYQQIIKSNSNGFTFHPSTLSLNSGYQLLSAVISAGIGLGTGIISGLIILLVASQKGTEHFTDRTYWISDDGLSTGSNKSIKLEKSIKVPPPQEKSEVPKGEKEEEVGDQTLRQKNVRIQFSEVIPFDLSTPNFEMSIEEASKAEISHAYL